ncbi:hypothetical protein [Flavobacterium caeni]|uniref:hypothetical protein n=1 Tax=Flavobacterium caeni TaxID=490189 RepID=UPI00111314EF|nr:hypothetical protein [Flavobacterium caeni]
MAEATQFAGAAFAQMRLTLGDIAGRRTWSTRTLILIMRKIQIYALIFFILSHLSIPLVIFIEMDQLPNQKFSFFYITWILGILSLVLNFILATKILKNWWFALFVLTGIMWLMPMLLVTIFGIPFLLIHLLVLIHLHKEYYSSVK